MESQAITGQKTRRGFNLIESAIVLGVVGLVIGGIWVAASTIRENQIVNDISNGALVLHNNVQQFLAKEKFVNNQVSHSLALAMKMYPADWEDSYVGDVMVGIGGGSIIGGWEEYAYYLRVSFPIGKSALCQKVALKLINDSWPSINSIFAYQPPYAYIYPFGGGLYQLTHLTGKIAPGDPGIKALCTTEGYGRYTFFIGYRGYR